MAQFQEDYGQYSTPNQQGFYQSGYSMETPSGGYDPQSQQQQQWGMNQGTSFYSAPPPPVQSQFPSTDPYGQQGYSAGYMEQSSQAPAPVHQGVSGGGGVPGSMDMDPGSLGQMDSGQGGYVGSEGYGTSDAFEDEPPLLEELGINFELIKQKTLSVLNPLQQTDPSIMNDIDLAGPLIYCLLFGLVLLLSGKVHFGYIYGVGLLGCTSMYVVLNLMSSSGVSVGCVMSVLGYCLVPMVLLSCFSIIVHLQGIVGTIMSLVIISWCSFSASKLFVSVLSMESMQLLIAYPCALLYGVFALLTVF